MKRGWKMRSRGGPATSGAVMRSTSHSIATRLISSIGWATVVIRGRTSPAHGTSSMPAIETSAGQRKPRSTVACRAPSAMTLLAPMMALGRSGRVSSGTVAA